MDRSVTYRFTDAGAQRLAFESVRNEVERSQRTADLQAALLLQRTAPSVPELSSKNYIQNGQIQRHNFRLLSPVKLSKCHAMWTFLT